MSWGEIKHAINSTIGTPNFVPLDKFLKAETENLYYEIMSAMSDIILDVKILVVPPKEEISNGEYKETNWVRAILPHGVKKIGDEAFKECRTLVGINLPSSIKSIGVDAFENTALKTILIPDSVTSIGRSAFYHCESLTSVVIPDSVTNISNWTFGYCESLTSVVIPDSVTSIGDSAFYVCESLTSVVIPDSVTSIGEYAFSGAPISDIYYKGTEEQWQQISVATGNSVLLDATIHYNYVGD